MAVSLEPMRLPVTGGSNGLESMVTGSPGTALLAAIGCPMGSRDAEHVVLPAEFARWGVAIMAPMVLLGSDGHTSQEAAQRAAERLSLPLNIYTVGSDLVDVNCSFYTAYGITPAGAVLVRPDSFVAWRSEHQEKEPERAIEQALSNLLFR